MPVSLGVRSHAQKGFIPISKAKQLEGRTYSLKLIMSLPSENIFYCIDNGLTFQKKREKSLRNTVSGCSISWPFKLMTDKGGERYRVCWKEKVGEKDDGWDSVRVKGRLAVEFVLPGLSHQALQKVALSHHKLSSVMWKYLVFSKKMF